MLTILGTNTASLVYIAISLLTLSGLLNVNTNIINLLQVLGGIYLAYIGLDTFVNRKRLTNDASITAPTSSILGKSFFVGISNPKDILFFLAFFPSFLSVSNNFPFSSILLTATWVVVDYLVLIAVGLAAKLIYTPGNSVYINMISGIIFCLIGVYAFVCGILSFI